MCGTTTVRWTLQRVDAVLANTAGPDFEMQLPAVKAAIAAGVDYADIAADGRATDEVLALDGEMRVKRRTALIGVGAAHG